MKKKLYGLVIFALLIIFLIVGVSGAAYLNQSYKRGVARNHDEEGIRFTSNYLSLVSNPQDENSLSHRIITYHQNEDDSIICGIDIRNYVPGNTNLINEYTIQYSFSVTFKNGTPGKEYQVNDQKYVADDQGNCNILLDNQLLLGRSKNVNSYTICIYKQDLDNINMIVKAIPTNLTYTGNKALAMKILPCTVSETQSFSCEGKFSDRTVNNMPEDFDAINYEVVLANGLAKVTLHWNSEIYELDSFFKSKLSVEDIIEENEDSIVFIMDQTKGNDSYRIPFYKKNKEICDSLNWQEMENIIYIEADKYVQDTMAN